MGTLSELREGSISQGWPHGILRRFVLLSGVHFQLSEKSDDLCLMPGMKFVVGPSHVRPLFIVHAIPYQSVSCCVKAARSGRERELRCKIQVLLYDDAALSCCLDA